MLSGIQMNFWIEILPNFVIHYLGEWEDEND